MSGTFTVRIRYCGGCNPEIDRGETVEQLKKILGEKAEFTYDLQMPADIILHVCGCAHACLDEEYAEADQHPVVSIQGLRVEREYVAATDLALRAAEESLRAVSG